MRCAEAPADQQLGFASAAILSGNAVHAGIVCTVERIGMHLQAEGKHNLAPMGMAGKDKIRRDSLLPGEPQRVMHQNDPEMRSIMRGHRRQRGIALLASLLWKVHSGQHQPLAVMFYEHILVHKQPYPAAADNIIRQRCIGLVVMIAVNRIGRSQGGRKLHVLCQPGRGIPFLCEVSAQKYRFYLPGQGCKESWEAAGGEYQ